ncbi:MAG: helix-turn-helix domain-containing protein [Burkholderiaceae bacterium]
MFSIGDLSRLTAVKVPTIRYYEQMGLLSAPSRTSGNQRRYAQKDLQQLGFIRHARDLGFSIEAIRGLIELNANPDKPCADADQTAAMQLNVVRDKITRLKRLEYELDRIVQGCDANGVVSECYVMASLCDHQLCSAEH